MGRRNLLFGPLSYPYISGGPASAFADVWGWWRADTYTGSSPNISLTDLSPNGRNMVQAAGTLTPGTAANGQARMVGNASARLTNAATLNRWPCTSLRLVEEQQVILVDFLDIKEEVLFRHYGQAMKVLTDTLFTTITEPITQQQTEVRIAAG